MIMKIQSLRPWNNSTTLARNNRAMWNKCTLIEKIYIWLGIANQVQGRNEYRLGMI